MQRTLTVGRRYQVRVERRHIDAGICHNRRQCMVAQAVNEAFGLGGLGYIEVEDLIAFTWQGMRWIFTVPKHHRMLMAQFDEAPDLAVPHTISMSLLAPFPIAPPASDERKDQINAARRRRNEILKEKGISTLHHPRFIPRHTFEDDA